MHDISIMLFVQRAEYSLIKKILRITSWFILDTIFVNMAFYTGYLVRFQGIIEPPAFRPYLHLWPHISTAHLIIFSIFRLYEPPNRFLKKQIFVNTSYASIISTFASMSIVYAMRRFWGFMPTLVFAFVLVFNIILVGGWRIFIRYES